MIGQELVAHPADGKVMRPVGGVVSGALLIVTFLQPDHDDTTPLSTEHLACAFTQYVFAEDHECDALVEDDQAD